MMSLMGYPIAGPTLPTGRARPPTRGPGTTHRGRARAGDRLRAAKETGLTSLPLHEMDQHTIWCAIIALACEISTWGPDTRPYRPPARRREPRRLGLRLLSIAGRLACTGTGDAPCGTCPPRTLGGTPGQPTTRGLHRPPRRRGKDPPRSAAASSATSPASSTAP